MHWQSHMRMNTPTHTHSQKERGWGKRERERGGRGKTERGEDRERERGGRERERLMQEGKQVFCSVDSVSLCNRLNFLYDNQEYAEMVLWMKC